MDHHAPQSHELPLAPTAAFSLPVDDALLNAIIRSATDAVVAVDEAQRIVLFNPAAERMFGWAAAEATGTPLDTLVPERYRPLHGGYVESFGRTGESNRPMGFGAVFGRRRSGEEFPIDASISKCEVGGRPVFAAILRDLSDSRKHQVELDRLLAELEARSEEMERFVYTVSHDLKSPLVTIKGFLGLLERDMAAGHAERIESDLTRIRTAADTMQRLLDDLLELSRVGRLVNSPEVVSLTDLADEAAELVAGRLAQRGVTVTVPRDLPRVSVDRRRFVEVFQNLLDNAAKYMGDAASPAVTIDAVEDGSTVVCRVRDNGIGLDPVYADKIFGLFSKLDPRTEGTGIGLSIVKRVVETHGGRVWVESPGVGLGATFTFTIPTHGARQVPS
jgi:two-component system sensor kinase FixL